MPEAIAVLHAKYKQALSDYTEARRRSVASLRYMLANPVHIRLTKELQEVSEAISDLSAGFRLDVQQISLGEFAVTQAAARRPRDMKIAAAWEKLRDAHGSLEVHLALTRDRLLYELEDFEKSWGKLRVVSNLTEQSAVLVEETAV